MSYRASIKNDDLRMFVAVGLVDCSSVDDLIEKQIQHRVDEKCKQEVTVEQVYLVDMEIKMYA